MIWAQFGPSDWPDPLTLSRHIHLPQTGCRRAAGSHLGTGPGARFREAGDPWRGLAFVASGYEAVSGRGTRRG
jgi:hypothetical protein